MTSLVPDAGDEGVVESDLAALKRLPAWLAREGFVDAFVVYGSYNSRAERWAADLPLLPPNLQLLFRLFLLGESVEVERLLELLPEEDVGSLQRLAILFS